MVAAASGGGQASSKPSTTVSPMCSGGSRSKSCTTMSPIGTGGAGGAVLIGLIGTGGSMSKACTVSSGGSMSSVSGGAVLIGGAAVRVSPHPSAWVLDRVAVLVCVADGVAELVSLPAVLRHLLFLNSRSTFSH